MVTTQVWIRKRKLANGKTSYHLRWICPTAKRWKSRHIGTDRKKADRAAALLSKELEDGTYRSLERISWDGFVDDHIAKIQGRADRRVATTVLKEFGRICNPLTPKHVTYGLIEEYIGYLKTKHNSTATRNKKLRYLRAAFNKAIKRGYMVVNPLEGWIWERENRKEIRILKADEELALMMVCENMHGEQLSAFVQFALLTWGRFAEITGLLWQDIDFEDHCVLFRNTKSHEDRYVPIARSSELWSVLLRLQIKTQQQGGPFTNFHNNSDFHKRIWGKVLSLAGIKPLGLHDLRRTGITRALLAGLPLESVRRMAGHKSLTTTMKYYVKVTNQDLQEAVERLAKAT